jgi:hypothetical protein
MWCLMSPYFPLPHPSLCLVHPLPMSRLHVMIN